MSQLIMIAVGVVLLLGGIAVAINTSMGGTRSDYDDRSDVLMTIGAVVIFLGIIPLLHNLVFPTQGATP